MTSLRSAARNSFTGVIAAALLAATLLAPTRADARVFFSVTIAPPLLPIYDQPFCPGEGYLWTPGYWAYGSRGYFWVEGAWVEAPYEGALWTPGYWAYDEGAYLWNPGYWGNTVGYYGGIDYGFGYLGTGFYGGYWNRGLFFYNRGYNHVDDHRIRNTYDDRGHGGTYVHPGGRAFDPHPPTWAGRGEGPGFDRNNNGAFNRGDDRDERGSRINDGRDQRSNASDDRQGFHGNPAPSTVDNPRQGGFGSQASQGYRGTQQNQPNDRFGGNAHAAPMPHGGYNTNRTSQPQGQQNTVQQTRPPQQEVAQPNRAPQQANLPQYRVPQQQPYAASPATQQQPSGAQPSGRNFDRFQPRTTNPPQTMNEPTGGQGGGGFHGSFGGGRR